MAGRDDELVQAEAEAEICSSRSPACRLQFPTFPFHPLPFEFEFTSVPTVPTVTVPLGAPGTPRHMTETDFDERLSLSSQNNSPPLQTYMYATKFTVYTLTISA